MVRTPFTAHAIAVMPLPQAAAVAVLPIDAVVSRISATLYGVSAEPAALAVALAETGIEVIPKIRPKKVGTFVVSDTVMRFTAGLHGGDAQEDVV